MAPSVSLSAGELSALSRGALDRDVTGPELTLVWPRTDALLLGAFQRSEEVAELDASLPRLRRGSGGAAVRVGPGVLYVGLSLPHPGALVPATCDQILNRAVRPVLRALTRTSTPTHYFGRDWLSAGKRPVAYVSFGHDAGTRHTLVEAFVSVSALALPQADRASYGERPPATLAGLSGKTPDEARIEAALAEAFGLTAQEPAPLAPLEGSAAPVKEPPWRARVDEAIGPIFAGEDGQLRLRLGGELMASRDRVAWLEARANDAPDDALDALVDEAFTRTDGAAVALFGVRALASIRDVLRAGRGPT